MLRMSEDHVPPELNKVRYQQTWREWKIVGGENGGKFNNNNLKNHTLKKMYI